MKIGELIKKLEEIQELHGDIECQLQSDPSLGKPVENFPEFSVQEEQYDDGWVVNLRAWPY